MATVDGTRTLPWSWYTDATVLELERERIFRRSWQYVGHAGEVAEPGSFSATRVSELEVNVQAAIEKSPKDRCNPDDLPPEVVEAPAVDTDGDGLEDPVDECPRKPEDKDDRPYSHPYYWAAFVLIGDPF